MMDFRNAQFIADGRIDCEVDHPKFGWIPYTIKVDGSAMFLTAAGVAEPYVAPPDPPEPTAEEILAAERATMICSRLQARLALGAATCAALDAMADDAETPWALAQTLKYAQTWHRTHETMDEIGWALGYTADEIDALFRVAMAL